METEQEYKTIVYAIKGKIAKTDNYNKLWELSRLTAKLMNCISMGHYHNLLNDQKLIRNFGYDLSKDEKWSSLASANRSVANNEVYSRFKSQNLKDIKSFKKNPPTFKPAIYICERNYDIERINGKVYFDITMQSTKVPAEERSMRLEWIADKGDRARQAVVNKIINGEEKKRQLKISVKDNRFYLSMAVSKDVLQLTNIQRCLGVQVARNRALQLGLSDHKSHTSETQRDDNKRLAAFGDDIVEFRKRNEVRRKKIQMQYPDSGRKGHGRKRALLPIEVLSKKYDNFKDMKNKQWASWVVEIAKNNKACIALEDLNGLNTSENFLKNWTYADLQSKIEMKAAMEGVPVVWINPKDTTRACTKCGHTHENNIKLKGEENADFKCGACGYFAHYGWNAAQNIAKLGWQEYLKDQPKTDELQKAV